MKNQICLLIIVLFQLSVFGQNMEISWQRCYGGSDDDRATDILSIDGSYFMIGGTYSDNGDISFNHGSSDAWVIKMDSTGNIIWEKTYGGSNGEFWRRIFLAPDNCFYLLGASGSWDGDISYDPWPGSNDLWIAKIDSVGNLIWEKIIGGGMIDMVESGTLAQDGGVVVFGWTGSQNGDITVNYGMYDMWMVKLNSDGDIEWDRSFGTDDFDYGHAIIQTSDGGFLVGGASTIGNGGNLTCDPYNYNAEAILIKLDSLGNIEWQQCYGGSGHDGVYGLLELEYGYAFTAFSESSDGDVTGWHGDNDIWFVQTDQLGNIIWEQCYGGYNGEIAHDLYKQINGDFIIFGQTYSNDGDVSGNHSFSEYENDIWMLKISSEGDLLLQQCFGGEGSESISGIRFGVEIKSDNNYIIAALTDYGPSYDVQCQPHGGNGDEDWWVFEIDLEDTTSIFDKLAVQDNLRVYPNPAGEYVVFSFATPPTPLKGGEPGTIQIIDVFGREVANKPITGENTVFDLRGWQNGIYFYSTKIEGTLYCGKVIIQK